MAAAAAEAIEAPTIVLLLDNGQPHGEAQAAPPSGCLLTVRQMGGKEDSRRARLSSAGVGASGRRGGKQKSKGARSKEWPAGGCLGKEQCIGRGVWWTRCVVSLEVR